LAFEYTYDLVLGKLIDSVNDRTTESETQGRQVTREPAN
jgi:hypothetical protein